jgi:hypothetical protein
MWDGEEVQAAKNANMNLRTLAGLALSYGMKR